MQDDIHLIEKCRILVEEKVRLGQSEGWKESDFELVSTQIEKDTGIVLSVTTLKRIWGKVKYDHKPNITTLNTLAKFNGFENWRAFTHQQQLKNGHSKAGNGQSNHYPIKDYQRERFVWRNAKRFMLVFVGIAVLGIGIVVTAYTRKGKEKPLNTNLFSFSSKKVISEGVPNTVIFDYDVHAADAGDSIFIQQSWDEQLRRRVSYENKHATFIYYYPSFYNAKLLVNNQIVKEHDLLITTAGWLPLIRKHPDAPVYFNLEEAKANGALALSIEKIKAALAPRYDGVPVIDYYNIQSFDSLSSDDFTFETAIRNTYQASAGVCQKTEVRIFFGQNFVLVPLSAKGCVSDLNFYFLGDSKNGKEEDLSAFGCDFSEWVTLKVHVKSHRGTIHINNRLVYEGVVPSERTSIATGVDFRFTGAGSVDYVRLTKSDGSIVFADEF
jgi:hypothetical protein